MLIKLWLNQNLVIMEEAWTLAAQRWQQSKGKKTTGAKSNGKNIVSLSNELTTTHINLTRPPQRELMKPLFSALAVDAPEDIKKIDEDKKHLINWVYF